MCGPGPARLVGSVRMRVRGARHAGVWLSRWAAAAARLSKSPVKHAHVLRVCARRVESVLSIDRPSARPFAGLKAWISFRHFHPTRSSARITHTSARVTHKTLIPLAPPPLSPGATTFRACAYRPRLCSQSTPAPPAHLEMRVRQRVTRAAVARIERARARSSAGRVCALRGAREWSQSYRSIAHRPGRRGVKSMDKLSSFPLARRCPARAQRRRPSPLLTRARAARCRICPSPLPRTEFVDSPLYMSGLQLRSSSMGLPSLVFGLDPPAHAHTPAYAAAGGFCLAWR